MARDTQHFISVGDGKGADYFAALFRIAVAPLAAGTASVRFEVFGIDALAETFFGNEHDAFTRFRPHGRRDLVSFGKFHTARSAARPSHRPHVVFRYAERFASA